MEKWERPKRAMRRLWQRKDRTEKQLGIVDEQVASKDEVGRQAGDVVRQAGDFKGWLGRQQGSCFWMFSAFSGLAIQAFSRSSNPRSNLCCQRGETDLVMVTLCGKKHTLNCTKYRFYHLMKGADRHGCLTPHSEDHCDEDYGNRLAHLILRIMMMFHWT